jgi:hypothetical protein
MPDSPAPPRNRLRHDRPPPRPPGRLRQLAGTRVHRLVRQHHSERAQAEPRGGEARTRRPGRHAASHRARRQRAAAQHEHADGQGPTLRHDAFPPRRTARRSRPGRPRPGSLPARAWRTRSVSSPTRRRTRGSSAAPAVRCPPSPRADASRAAPPPRPATPAPGVDCAAPKRPGSTARE